MFPFLRSAWRCTADAANNVPTAVLTLALAATLCGPAHATPLDDMRTSPVSALEFGSFKLETALMAVKDWPSPLEGASVSYHVDPDQLTIVVALAKTDSESFRADCARTVARVRQLLYVDANGVAPMGRSYLNAYFNAVGRGKPREAALRAIDASTLIRVDVVGRGSCQAALLKAPVTFGASAPK